MSDRLSFEDFLFIGVFGGFVSSIIYAIPLFIAEFFTGFTLSEEYKIAVSGIIWFIILLVTFLCYVGGWVSEMNKAIKFMHEHKKKRGKKK